MRRPLFIVKSLAVVFFSLMLFEFLQELWGGLFQVTSAVCKSPPEGQMGNTVTLHVGRSSDHPHAVVCVWAENGTEQIVRYDYQGADVRLECLWLKILWLPHFRVSRLLSLAPTALPGSGVLPRRTGRIWASSPSNDPLLPSMCRIRFRYRSGPEEETRTVYSEAFSLP
jgi:hypothetical protein